MKLTISVSDDLGQWAQNAEGLVVSRVCQEALALERSNREAVGSLAPKLQRYEIEVHSDPVGPDGAFVLIAVELYADGRGLRVFLTRKGTIVVHTEWDFSLNTFSSFEMFEERWNEHCHPQTNPLTVRAAVAQALGKGPLLLDI